MDSQNTYQQEPDAFDTVLVRGKPGFYKTAYGLQLVPASGIIKMLASEAPMLLALDGFSLLGDEKVEESTDGSAANIGLDDSFLAADTPASGDAAGEPEPGDSAVAPDNAAENGTPEGGVVPPAEETDGAQDSGDEAPGGEETKQGEVEPSVPAPDAPIVTNKKVK